MNFPCPKCNTPNRGVLLFNLVAPCDTCSGIVPEKKKEKYTIESHKDLLKLGKFIRVALACGPEWDRKYTQTRLEKRGVADFTWTEYSVFLTHPYLTDYPDDICVIQWSE